MDRSRRVNDRDQAPLLETPADDVPEAHSSALRRLRPLRLVRRDGDAPGEAAGGEWTPPLLVLP